MAIIFIRTLIFYIITIFALRVMGKRQIGELEPSELVVTILISELSTLPIQDNNIPILYALIPIFALVSFEMLSSVISLKSLGFRTFLSGCYNVIIENGKINQREMNKTQLTLDELMEELRKGGAVRPEDVRFCVLETSGKMSVLLKGETSVTALPVPLVVDGCIIKSNLKKLGFTKSDILRMLNERGVSSFSQTFWMSVCENEINVIKKDES
ncbi:MAG: hypothetical protein DBX47_00335 [Clostridiales bacterium]|nr:MAG: hypothetical protein DBX47_00335 [Clostridiales bacterium]